MTFGFIACGSGSSDSPVEGPVFRGTFTTRADVIGTAGLVTVELDKPKSDGAMSGRLQSGALVVELIGGYEAESGLFLLAANGDDLRYTINGLYNAGGVEYASAMVMALNNEYKVDAFSITEGGQPIKAIVRGSQGQAGLMRSVSGTPINNFAPFFRGRWSTSGEDLVTYPLPGVPGSEVNHTYKVSALINPLTMQLVEVATKTGYESNYYNALLAGLVHTTEMRMTIAEGIAREDGDFDIIISLPMYDPGADGLESLLTEFLALRGLTAKRIPKANWSLNPTEYEYHITDSLIGGIDRHTFESNRDNTDNVPRFADTYKALAEFPNSFFLLDRLQRTRVPDTIYMKFLMKPIGNNNFALERYWEIFGDGSEAGYFDTLEWARNVTISGEWFSSPFAKGNNN